MSNKKVVGAGKKLFKKIAKWCRKNENKIVLAIGMFLLVAISFEFGVLQGQKWQQSPLIIKTSGSFNKQISTDKIKSESDFKKSVAGNETVASLIGNNEKCVFVASKKSKKYHKADCRFAKRIKLDNKVCFKSEAEAKKKGYIPAHCLK